MIRPFDHGADIIGKREVISLQIERGAHPRSVHSATKWIGGHGTTLGGVIISSGQSDNHRMPETRLDTFSGKFDFTRGKFPGFTEPSESHNGISLSEEFGPMAFTMKLQMEILRGIGTCMGPFTAFLLLQGLETLSLRAERQCTNALALAE